MLKVKIVKYGKKQRRGEFLGFNLTVEDKMMGRFEG